MNWREKFFKKLFLDKQDDKESKHERNILSLQVDDYKVRVYEFILTCETILEVIKENDDRNFWMDRIYWREGESTEFLREKIKEGIDSCKKVAEYNKIKPSIEKKKKEEKERNLEQLKLLNGLKITLEQL